MTGKLTATEYRLRSAERLLRRAKDETIDRRLYDAIVKWLEDPR